MKTKTKWVVLLCAFQMPQCAHRLRIETIPPEARVFALNENGARGKLLGHSPLNVEEVEAKGLAGIEIDQSGFIPQRILIPSGMPSQVEIKTQLTAFTESWVRSLPTEYSSRTLETATGDMVRLQSIMYTRNDEEMNVILRNLQPKYGRLSIYHYLIGQYHFFRERYVESTQAFSKAVELDPSNADARRMLTLVDTKVISNSQSDRNRSMAALEASARDISELGNGKVRSFPQSQAGKNHQGFEVVLPVDPLFRPGTAKTTREAIQLAQKLSNEFRRIRHPLKILIECHTDSNIGESQTGGAPEGASRGQVRLQSFLELSSARAAAFLELLQSEGAEFANTAIAGYGNTKPLQPEFNNGVPNPKAQATNRRLVVKISYESGSKEIFQDDFDTLSQGASRSQAPKNSQNPVNRTSESKKSRPSQKASSAPTPKNSDSENIEAPRAPKVVLPDAEGSEGEDKGSSQ